MTEKQGQSVLVKGAIVAGNTLEKVVKRNWAGKETNQFVDDNNAEIAEAEVGEIGANGQAAEFSFPNANGARRERVSL